MILTFGSSHEWEGNRPSVKAATPRGLYFSLARRVAAPFAGGSDGIVHRNVFDIRARISVAFELTRRIEFQHEHHAAKRGNATGVS